MSSPSLAPSRPDAEQAEEVAERGSSALSRVALVGRSVFYLVLAGLTASLAARHWSGQQANSNGALEVLTRPLIGKVAVGITAFAFAVYGLTRLVAAFRGQDRQAREDDGRDASDQPKDKPTRRVTAALGGLFYLAMAYVPTSFLLGKRKQGNEQQQKAMTARILRLPAGREIVIAVGLLIIGVCVYQIRKALTEGYTQGLRLDQASPRTRRLVEWTGKVGIAARALVFGPVGIFLIVAAVQFDPNHAKGIDGELAGLAQHAWGRAVLGLIAAGLVVFAIYGLFEARYRDVQATS